MRGNPNTQALFEGSGRGGGADLSVRTRAVLKAPVSPLGDGFQCGRSEPSGCTFFLRNVVTTVDTFDLLSCLVCADSRWCLAAPAWVREVNLKLDESGASTMQPGNLNIDH